MEEIENQPIQTKPANIEMKLEFLRDVLEAAEKRRDAVENKSSILLASNAILLTAIATLGIPDLFNSNNLSKCLWLIILLVTLTLFSVAVSTLCAIQVLGRPKRSLRELNIPSSGFNVYFSGKIAEFDNAKTYFNVIESITESQILNQLVTQAHNLSSIVMYRYRWFEFAHYAFIIGIASFIVLTLLKILT